jgi:GTP-binding protein
VEAANPEEQLEVLMPALEKKTDDSWAIEEEDEGLFRISGRRVERMVAMTDFENDSAVRYLQRKLDRIGITDKLRELGAQEGDTIAIGEFEFSFTDEQ